MVLNNKSQVLFYTLMLSSIILVLALAFAPIIKQFIEQSSSDMNCSDPSISEYDQVTCYSLDILFWFIVGLFIVIGLIVLGSKITGG